MKNACLIIKNFISGEINPWEWDDFISSKEKEETLVKLIRFCSDIQILYPSDSDGAYCSEMGIIKLEEAADAYQAGDAIFLDWLSSNESGG
jgi:hypothetical protein